MSVFGALPELKLRTSVYCIVIALCSSDLDIADLCYFT